MTAETDCPVVVLTSGQMLKLRQVMLYDENAVIQVAALRAYAAKGLGGGIGILGTPSLEFAEALLQKHGKSARDIAGGFLRLGGQPRYVQNGDEFVFVTTDVDDMSIRWPQIVAYRPMQSTGTNPT